MNRPAWLWCSRKGNVMRVPCLRPSLHHYPRSIITHAIMDKASDRDQIRAQLTGYDLVPVSPPKSTRLAPIDYDRDLYRLREKVERFFNKLKPFRRIATRYEKLSHTFLAFIHLVAAWISIQ